MKSWSDDLGKLVLRLTLGVLLLFHGASKLENGIAWMGPMLEKFGLPAFVSYGAYIGEVLAPALIILGLFTRLGGLIVVVFMTMAVLLSHTGQFFTLSKSGGWALELQALYFFGGLAVLLLGAGRYSVGGANGRWN